MESEMKMRTEKHSALLNELFGKKLETEQKLFALKWSDPKRPQLRQQAQALDRQFVDAIKKARSMKFKSKEPQLIGA